MPTAHHITRPSAWVVVGSLGFGFWYPPIKQGGKLSYIKHSVRGWKGLQGEKIRLVFTYHFRWSCSWIDYSWIVGASLLWDTCFVWSCNFYIRVLFVNNKPPPRKNKYHNLFNVGRIIFHVLQCLWATHALARVSPMLGWTNVWWWGGLQITQGFCWGCYSRFPIVSIYGWEGTIV